MFDSTLIIAGVVYFAYMSALWCLGLRIGNAGLVDFGWPSGFTALAVSFAYFGDGDWKRQVLIASLYCVCGARFMIGWIVRTSQGGEDRRWTYWRKRWQNGDGLFSIRSVSINLFAFYHAQTFATLLVLIVPLRLACGNGDPHINLLEWIALIVWFVSFLLENIADYQLDQFLKQPSGKPGVCRKGLWKYSRHPNYFFEFLIWVSYSIFAWPSASTVPEYVLLLLVPITAYWFLVYFTGIPITEAASRDRRGAAYEQYEQETNRFFPWFPKPRSAELNQAE